VAALDTVANYVTEARTILQDATVPYRYSDADLKNALGLGIYEVRRLRPDLFLGHNTHTMPDITSATADGTTVTFDKMYRMVLVHFIVGHVTKRDEEEASEARAAAFLQAALGSLTGGA
jgi:hypothetical protein